MNMQQKEVLDWRRGVRFYPVNFNYLSQVSKDLHLCFSSFGTNWAKFPDGAIEPILLTALRVYYYQNYAEVLVQCGRDRPTDMELTVLGRQFFVPRFIRDMFREICRPMVFAGNYYAPDIRYERRSYSDITNIFDENVKINSMNLWMLAWKHLGVELVELLPEGVQPAPLSFYHEPSNSIYCSSWLQPWRLEAVSYIKHLVWLNPVQSHTPEELRPLEIYESVIHDRVVGIYDFIYHPVTNLVPRFSVVTQHTRFPSEEHRSRTPPKSQRVRRKPKPDLDKEIGPIIGRE